MAAGSEASWRQRWHRLVHALDCIPSECEEAQLVDAFARPLAPTVVAFANAHALNSAARSRSFCEALAGADWLLRDGSGMAILLSLLRQPPGRNMNGTDLIPKLLQRHAGRTIALFGTQEPYLGRARERVMRAVAPGSRCVTAHGFLAPAEYVALARRHAPALIVLGMGMPRQEEVAGELRAALRHPCLIVCGGAIIDFLGGKTPRAPRWVRALGMEWGYRLALEPRRLFRRYVLGNPLFLARALALAAGSRRGRAAARGTR